VQRAPQHGVPPPGPGIVTFSIAVAKLCRIECGTTRSASGMPARAATRAVRSDPGNEEEGDAALADRARRAREAAVAARRAERENE
jgi:hypothetical protein